MVIFSSGVDTGLCYRLLEMTARDIVEERDSFHEAR